MTNGHWSLVLSMAIGMALVGCEKQDTPKPTADPAKTAEKMVSDGMKSASDATKEVAADAKDAAAKLAADAETKITEATNYIKENKLDLAEKTLDALDKIKAELPEAIQTKLTQARTLLDNAKKAVAK